MLKQLLSKLLPSKNEAKATKPEVIVQTKKVFLYETDRSKLENIIQSPARNGPHQGYVYIIQEHKNGWFKMGSSTTIDKSLNVFNVKLPFDYHLVHLIKSGDVQSTEKAFHHHFASKQFQGEWYDFSSKDIAWIKSGAYTPEIAVTIGTHSQMSNDQPLTPKQLVYAKSMIKRLGSSYSLAVEESSLTQMDLKRLSVYFRFKNQGALKNLVESGVIKKKELVNR
ncbi:GIY-YIG nuclease family protein [Rossellomorea aquimaris]|uniref:GIY-YIG nuclease family protein n=1 Tax=Rossellomorea aquimaris TaxID=189382 RepID=UPI003CED44D1